jgi:hypothetical protein
MMEQAMNGVAEVPGKVFAIGLRATKLKGVA